MICELMVKRGCNMYAAVLTGVTEASSDVVICRKSSKKRHLPLNRGK